MELPLDNIWLPAPQPAKKVMVVLHGLGDSSGSVVRTLSAGVISGASAKKCSPAPVFVYRFASLARSASRTSWRSARKSCEK